VALSRFNAHLYTVPAMSASLLVFRSSGAGAEYATWRQLHFGNSTSAAGAPDFDGEKDGVTNFGEFAFNMNPLLADAAPVAPSAGTSGLPALGQTTVDGEPRLTLEYIRHKTAGTYQVRASSTLGDFQPIIPVVVEGPTSVSLDYERVKVADLVAIDDPAVPKRFLQIFVTFP